jgi:DnaJ like chaperone protein
MKKKCNTKKDDSFDTIKKNYRKLIKKYHYDTIASQNLSKEEIDQAKEKTQKINEAYSIIKEKYKSKI